MRHYAYILLVLELITGIVVCQNKFGDGSDGELVVDNGETYYIDQIKANVVGNNSSGQNAIGVNSNNGFSIGDEILIITMQDPTTENFDENLAGNYEFRTIASIENDFLYLDNVLEHSFNTDEGIVHQVIRIPNFSNVTNNGYVNIQDWDGITGGVLCMRVSGTLINNGTFEGNHKGYRGGNVGAEPPPYYTNPPGYPGEGITGVLTYQTTSPNINGGGGGALSGNNSDVGTSGGGGGNQSSGGTPWNGCTGGGCGVCSNYSNPGQGGSAVFNSNWYNKLLIGGGGGGGSHDNSTHSDNQYAGSGGRGGGSIIIFASEIVNNGSIKTDGDNGGGPSWASHHGSGGGGAGGTIWISSLNINNDNGYIESIGGIGAESICDQGGDGGVGYIRLDLPSGINPPETNPDAYVIELDIISTWHISTTGSDEMGDGSEENPFATIQNGIDVSSDGDTVLVADGTYQEQISIFGKGLFINSQNGSTLTIIHSDGGEGVTISGAGSKTTIKGFSLTGGARGIYCADNTTRPLDILECNIYGNNCSGILVQGSTNSNISNNKIYDNGGIGCGGPGAGIRFMNSSEATVDNNSIFNNTSKLGDVGSDGGGISVEGSSTVNLHHNLIYNNTAISGGGIFVDGATIIANNNTIYGNQAIHNPDNTSWSGGGGYRLINPINSTIYNEIIYENYSDNTWGYNSSCIRANEGGSSTIGYCLTSGGWNTGNSISIYGDFLTTDPLFTDPDNGDFTLQLTSPCIDAGDPDSEYDPDGSIADMGAYYFDRTFGCTDPTAINYDPEATSNDGSCYHDVLTDIDGNEYQAVQIGEQLWMSENLKVTKYRDGTAIPTGLSNSEWENTTSGAYAVYDNNETHADTYGYLYNWYAVDDSRNIAPDGWHVPTDDEWTTLTDYLGGTSVAGGKMKETGTSHWNSPNTGATNESGFTAFPGGYRNDGDGNYGNIGSSGYFWSSSEIYSSLAWERLLNYNSSEVNRYYTNKEHGFSVRCVRD